MAVTVVTPTIAGSDVAMTIVKAGEAATVCLPMYRASDGSYYIGDFGSSATADIAGIVDMVPSAADIYISLITSGKVNIASGTLTIGTTYFLGASGAIIEYSDVSLAGNYITVLGTAITTSAIELAIGASGNTK